MGPGRHERDDRRLQGSQGKFPHLVGIRRRLEVVAAGTREMQRRIGGPKKDHIGFEIGIGEGDDDPDARLGPRVHRLLVDHRPRSFQPTSAHEFEPDFPDRPIGAELIGRARLEAFEVFPRAVQEVVEHRNQLAAIVHDQRLHLAIHLLPLGVIELRSRGEQQLVELRVVPEGLVPG